MKRGVAYVAVKNREYVLYVAASILSLRDSGYEGPISIFTDLPVSCFDNFRSLNVDIVTVKPPENVARPSRWVKTQLAFLSPYDETLFLDADTVVLGSIEGIWDFLSEGSVAVCFDVNPTLAGARHGTFVEYVYTLKRCPPSSFQYNSGVFLWKRSKESFDFFKEWRKEWQRFEDVDQLAFIRSVQNTGVVLSRLPQIYNWNERFLDYEQPVIYHCLHLKPRLNNRFPGLYKKASMLAGVAVPPSGMWVVKYIARVPRNLFQRIMRWLVRFRLEKLASRDFARRHKNL